MLKVLIVEDNNIASFQAKNMVIQQVDADIHVANCGEDALAICKDTGFDVIFMDIGLGSGIDGVETSRRIRDIEKVIKRSPAYICALTAHSLSPGDIEHHRKMGIDKSYNKPARKEIIKEVLSIIT